MMRVFASLAFIMVMSGCASAPSPQQESPADAIETPRISIVRVHVSDMDRSVRFYRDVFGLGEPRAFGANVRVLTLNENGAVLSLSSASPGRPNGSYAIVVSDIDAVMARTQAAGGAITRAPQGGSPRIGFIADPDGADIEIIQLPASR